MPNPNDERSYSGCCSLFCRGRLGDLLIDTVTTYEQPITTKVKSLPIAIIYRFLQFLVVIFTIIYVIWYRSGYQDQDSSLISSVILSVKGIGYIGENHLEQLDSSGYLIPELDSNSIFIMTNFIRTDQERKRCCENLKFNSFSSQNYSKCNINFQYVSIDSIRIASKCNSFEDKCEITGWCSIENDHFLPNPIMDTLNYQITIKSFVEFSRFHVSRNNSFNTQEDTQQCCYHPIHNKLSSVFRVGDLLNIVETNDKQRYEMLMYGGIIRIQINWMCNLDSGIDQCRPEYSFKRLDSSLNDKNISPGFSFRFASNWKILNRSYRTLTKAYGLKFIVNTNGHARRFDLFVLTHNIGSIIGILSLLTVMCNVIVSHLYRKNADYREVEIQSDDANFLLTNF